MKNGIKLSLAVAAIALMVVGNIGLAHANPIIRLFDKANSQAEQLQDFLSSSVADSGYGATPSEKLIFVARDKTDATVARALLTKGANVNTKDETGATPLILAARNGHNAIMRVLIANGANLDAQDTDGHTALMQATKKGNGTSAKILLDSGANPNAQNHSGQTALMLSADRNRNYIAKTLLKKGADVSIRDENGNTAHSYATSRNLPSGAMIKLVNHEVK